jgi:hypothetical protein
MSSARVFLIPHSDASADEVRDTRARAWAYTFSCYLAKQQDTGRYCGGDGERYTRKEGSTACHDK